MYCGFFTNVKDRDVDHHQMDFATLVGLLEDSSGVDWHRTEKEGAHAFIPAHFDPPYRAKANVTARYAFALDADGDRPGDPGFERMLALLDALPFQYCIHTTTKSSVATNRYRVILPCLPCDVATYEAACSSLDQMLSGGEGVFDTKTFDASRLSFVPKRWHGSPDRHYEWDEATTHHRFASRTTGDVIDAAHVISRYPPIAPAPEPEPFDHAAWLAARPVTTRASLADLTDLDRSPIVTEEMQSDYLMSSEGGRYFTFLCRVASRAICLSVPPDPDIVHTLGMQMNSRGPRSKRRSAREARRAVEWSLQNVAPAKPVKVSDAALLKSLKKLKKRKS